MNSNKVQINCNGCGFPIVIIIDENEIERCPECGVVNKKPIQENQSSPLGS